MTEAYGMNTVYESFVIFRNAFVLDMLEREEREDRAAHRTS